jgi:hypothetical protein
MIIYIKINKIDDLIEWKKTVVSSESPPHEKHGIWEGAVRSVTLGVWGRWGPIRFRPTN